MDEQKDEQNQTFDSVQDRLAEIVDEVKAEGISLDEALALYEEAVKLGLSACDLSEQDIETVLEISSETDETDGATPVDKAIVVDDALPDESDEADGANKVGEDVRTGEQELNL